MTKQCDVDVAIVGGGPVGLGLGIDLAQRGHSVRVMERSTRLHRIPKGQNLTQRSGEHFRAWGLSDAVRRISPIPPKFGNAGIVIYGALLGEYHYDWFQRSKVGAYYFAENERLPQYLLEQVMRDGAAALPGLDLRLGQQVIGLDQDETGATLRSRDRDTGREQECRARFAVGCDGARSFVRQAAGIGQEVDHQGPKMALIVFRSHALDKLLERYPGKSIYNVMNPGLDGYWQFLGRVDLDGGWFYHAPVPDDATADNFDAVAHLQAMAGTEFPLEVEHLGFWDLRISMAQAYRAGRVFIAGDAAHSHPPYGGYGVNTGLEDARNLAWKLAAKLDGWAGPGLLDSYGAERLPVFASVARDFIEPMISGQRDFLARFDPETDKPAFEAAWQARASATGNDAVTQFLPHYEGSPLVCGPRGAASGARGVHAVAARAGHHLAPQALPDGSDLWDALGPGFTLIDLVGDTALQARFQQAAAGLRCPLTLLTLADAALHKAYQADALLIRPDQFIAWAGDAAATNAAAILARAIGAGSPEPGQTG